MPTIWFNWGGTLGGYYVENGLTYDFTDYAAANNWDQKFDTAGMDIMTLHGELSAYPTSLSMVAVFYRADIFEKYGLEEPTTFDEFEAILATLKENGECPMSTASSPAGGWHLMRTMEQLIEHYAGPELHDQMNNLEESWNNEAFIQTLTTYQDWVEKGYFNEGFVTADPEDAPTKLYSGECVMVFEGQWAERNIFRRRAGSLVSMAFSYSRTAAQIVCPLLEKAISSMPTSRMKNWPPEWHSWISIMDPKPLQLIRQTTSTRCL